MFIIDVDEGTITETKHCGKCSNEKLKADEAEKKIIDTLKDLDTGHQIAILLSLASGLLNEESIFTKALILNEFAKSIGLRPI